jgi:hypothetical protein
VCVCVCVCVAREVTRNVEDFVSFYREHTGKFQILSFLE